MRRHLLGAVLSALLAVGALAVPAGASASPVLDYWWGEQVPVGESITGTLSEGHGIEFSSSDGLKTISCTRSALEGGVTANSGSEFVAEIDTVTFSGIWGPTGTACKYSLSGATVVISEPNVPWCLSSTVLGTVSIKSCESGPLTLPMQVYLGAQGLTPSCLYSAEQLGATYQAHKSPLTLTINGTMTKQSGSIWCPASLKVAFGGVYQMTTEGESGSAIQID